jgi:hypothetical protein
MPIDETRRQNTRASKDVFDAATLLLKQHFDPERTTPDSPNVLPIKARLDQAHHAFVLGLGYLAEYEYLSDTGNAGQAEKCLHLAENQQVWALIFASATQKANRYPDGSPFDAALGEQALYIQRRVFDSASNPALLSRLQTHLTQAETRGWKRPNAHSRLIIINGAEWCPDTANILRITVAFQMPAHLLFMAAENKRKKGFRSYSDHAIAVIEQHPNQPHLSIPVITFPDGDFLIEPKPHEFVIQLVAHHFL